MVTATVVALGMSFFLLHSRNQLYFCDPVCGHFCLRPEQAILYLVRAFGDLLFWPYFAVSTFVLTGHKCQFRLRLVRNKGTFFPEAHTCFNALYIPHYKEIEDMRRHLLELVKTDVTGFTLA